MKKIKTVLLIIALCFTAFTFTSCDTEPVHKHSYGPWTITKAATCTEAGSRIKTCSCGATKTEVIAPLGHNFVNGICTDCGAKQ